MTKPWQREGFNFNKSKGDDSVRPLDNGFPEPPQSTRATSTRMQPYENQSAGPCYPNENYVEYPQSRNQGYPQYTTGERVNSSNAPYPNAADPMVYRAVPDEVSDYREHQQNRVNEPNYTERTNQINNYAEQNSAPPTNGRPYVYPNRPETGQTVINRGNVQVNDFDAPGDKYRPYSGNGNQQMYSNTLTTVRILLCDQDEQLFPYLGQLSTIPGYQIEWIGIASNKPLAVGMVYEKKPEIVIIDQELPMGGLECANEIRAINPKAMIIFFVRPNSPDTVRLQSAGFRNILAKDYMGQYPVNLEDLAFVISQYGKQEARGLTPVFSTSDLQVRDSERNGKVIVLHSPKGGVGKTTLSVNLASIVKKYGGVNENKEALKVALVENVVNYRCCDNHLGLKDTARSMIDLTEFYDEKIQGFPDDRMVLDHMETSSIGLKVLLGAVSPQEADAIAGVGHGRMILAILEVLRRHFDYIFVDTDCVLGDEGTFSVIENSDQILCVVPMNETIAISNTITQFLPILHNLQNDTYKKVRIIINKVVTKSKYPIESIIEGFQRQGVHVIGTVAYVGSLIDDSIYERVPLVLLDEENPFFDNCFRIAEKIHPNMSRSANVKSQRNNNRPKGTPRGPRPVKKASLWQKIKQMFSRKKERQALETEHEEEDFVERDVRPGVKRNGQGSRFPRAR